jgi:hypothetical protein
VITSIKETINEVNCPSENIYPDSTLLQNYLSGDTTNIVQCFCTEEVLKKKHLNEYYVTKADGTRVNICSKALFQNDYGYISISSLAILIIPVLNFIADKGLTSITHLERNKTLTQDLSSNLWKLTIIKFINTAITLLITNLYIPEAEDSELGSLVLKGTYKNFSPQWYYYIGTVVIFTIITEAGTAHILGFVKYWFRLFRRLYDSRTLNGAGSKRKEKEFMELYVGPQIEIDGRYSSLCNIILCTLLFSTAMPILWPVCFFYILMHYWADKYLCKRYLI